MIAHHAIEEIAHQLFAMQNDLLHAMTWIIDGMRETLRDFSSSLTQVDQTYGVISICLRFLQSKSPLKFKTLSKSSQKFSISMGNLSTN